ncbi:MAG TPA: alpha/beta hydrolase [Hyphomonadaceae bacterium]|jgi:acetyl esterase/lipase|nr:alpha/beta hydrolase [Hyphomonadaceae bacterium]
MSTLVKMIFSLPESVIQAMAGKKTEVDGSILDPRIALMAKQAARQASMTMMPVGVARKGTQAALGLTMGKRRTSVAIRDMKVPGGRLPDGRPAQLDARLYTPPGATGNEPLLVYLHQGGCVLGGIWMADTWCSILAEEVRAFVLNVDYRHAPEHKFPAPVDDAIASFEWAVQNAKALGADGKRVGIGGDSAGGYLSAVVCLARREAKLSQPYLQLLIYPCTDWTSVGGTMKTMANAYPLSEPVMEWFAGHYLSSEDERKDWRVSPALVADKTGLAPALVYTASFDPLTTQAAAYADMLKEAGVKTTYRNYTSLSHSFTAMSGVVPAARKALDEIAADVKRAFG